MSFYTDYEIRGAVRSGTVKTFKARQIATSRNVLVHLLVDGNPTVLEQLASLPAQKRSHILEQGDRDGTAFVVTDLLDGFSTFESWLTAPVTEDFGASPSPGEFTQLFAKPAPGLESPAEPRSSPSPPTPADGGKPGEFTQFFKVPPAPPPAEPLPPAAPSLQPGEFTQFFSGMPKPTRPAMPPPENSPPARSTPQPAPPGAFTRIFQMTPDRTPGSEILSTPPPAPVRSTGEYTRVFGSTLPVEASSAPPPPVAAPPKASGDFTRIFEGPRVNVAPVSTPVVPPGVPTVTPPAVHYQAPIPVAPTVPSMPTPVAPQLSTPTMSSPAVYRRTNYLPLVIILGCMLVVALVLIVYFAMRNKPS